MRRRAFVAHALPYVLVLAALIPHPASAQPTAADVVGAAPHDSELVARVTGQTRDLPLHLRWVELALDARPSAAQMALAAREQRADVVVAIRGNAATGQTVYVYDAPHDALRTRRVAPSKHDRMSRSAAAETVALIVRGELRALLADREAEAERERERAASTAAVSGTSGTTTGSGGPASGGSTDAAANGGSTARTPPPTPSRPTRNEAQHQSATRETGSEAGKVEPDENEAGSQLTAANPFAGALDGPLALALAAGMRASLPIADHAMWSPSLALQLRLAHVGIELHGSTSFTAHLEQDSVRIGLRRHAFGGAVFASWRVGNDIDVAFGPALDLAFVQRTTLATGDDFMKTADRTWTTLTLAALADLRWRLLPRVGVSVRIGLDFPLHPLLFAYGEGRQLARQHSVEPWALASLFVDIWE